MAPLCNGSCTMHAGHGAPTLGIRQPCLLLRKIDRIRRQKEKSYQSKRYPAWENSDVLQAPPPCTTAHCATEKDSDEFSPKACKKRQNLRRGTPAPTEPRRPSRRYRLLLSLNFSRHEVESRSRARAQKETCSPKGPDGVLLPQQNGRGGQGSSPCPYNREDHQGAWAPHPPVTISKPLFRWPAVRCVAGQDFRHAQEREMAASHCYGRSWSEALRGEAARGDHDTSVLRPVVSRW